LRDLFGLLPILWSPSRRLADVMKRIATRWRRVITSAILDF